MPNKKIDADVFCPFYKRETDTKIICEGLVGDATTLSFKTKIAKRLHEKNFCTGKWCAGCPLNAALMLAYRERDPAIVV